MRGETNLRQHELDHVLYTTEELRAMQDAGLVRIDREKARAHPMPDGSDPDDAMDSDDWEIVDIELPQAKQQLTLRLDADMLDWFKAQGPGYQTRINAVLRSYFEQKKKR